MFKDAIILIIICSEFAVVCFIDLLGAGCIDLKYQSAPDETCETCLRRGGRCAVTELLKLQIAPGMAWQHGPEISRLMLCT